jgi:hypothetical protein
MESPDLWQISAYVGERGATLEEVKGIVESIHPGYSQYIGQEDDGVFLIPLPKRLEEKLLSKGYFELMVNGVNIGAEMP